jgi:hypothetical protein
MELVGMVEMAEPAMAGLVGLVGQWLVIHPMVEVEAVVVSFRMAEQVVLVILHLQMMELPDKVFQVPLLGLAEMAEVVELEDLVMRSV